MVRSVQGDCDKPYRVELIFGVRRCFARIPIVPIAKAGTSEQKK